MSRLSNVAPDFSGAARKELVGLFHSARAFDIRQFEDRASSELVRVLSVPTQELVARGVGVMGQLVARFDATPLPEEALNFELAVDHVLNAAPPSSRVADLAFLSLTELRQRQTRLAGHQASSDAWEVVCDCGSALRRVQKSSAAIEQALCEVEGVRPELPFHSELQVSLEVRRQYAKLWRFAADAGAPSGAAVLGALRGAGTLLAMLVGRDVYCRLREADRFQLRAVQRRIIAWLSQPFDAHAGLRLWQDFAAFVEMLRQVNLRQELLAHDTGALARALEALRAQQLVAARAMLQPVRGRDDALDDALETGDVAALLASVLELHTRLAGPGVLALPGEGL